MKIKIVHLLLNEEKESNRQVKSIESISQLSIYDDIEYIQIWNNLWVDELPNGFCGNVNNIRKSYYGNYTSFKNSFLNYFTDDVDFFIQVEGDALLEYPVDIIYKKIKEATIDIKNEHLDVLSFGSRFHLENGSKQSTTKLKTRDLHIVDKIIGAQFMIFPKRVREYVISKYNMEFWTTADIYYNIIFSSSYNMGIYNDMYVTQCDGESMIDNYVKVHIKSSAI